MTQTIVERAFLLLVVVAYLLVGALFAIRTPDWQAPDEPAHYNYIAQVAAVGCCPVIEPGDWQQGYQNELTTARFAPELLDRLDTIQYEDHQPPVYYLLASVVYRLTSGSLVALRLFSVLIGLGVVLCAYACAKVIYPERPGVALGAAAFVAFLPQHVAMLAAVNNDGLSELWIGLTLWATLLYLRGRSIQPWHLGFLIGLIFITKSTGYLMAGVVSLAVVLRWWASAERNFGQLLRAGLAFLIPALVIGGLWWGRNISVYGFPDFLGLGAHDLVVTEQPRTAEFIAEFGSERYINQAVSDTFNSFWGQFGWMALPLQGWMYQLFQALTGLALAGLLLPRSMLRETPTPPAEGRFRRQAWIVLVAVIVLAFAAYIFYNTEFLQLQGRYLFPALIPLGLLMALGVDAWRRWLLAWLPGAQWLAVMVFLLLALFDLYLILRVIPPGLAP